MFHEMTLKLYFMKCLERKISQCILPLKVVLEWLGINQTMAYLGKFQKILLGKKHVAIIVV